MEFLVFILYDICISTEGGNVMGFAEELSKHRKTRGMTQEELAEKCDVSRQAVAKWEKGESLPDVYLIAKLANMFGISIEELIWSKDTAVLENKNYYIRKLEEADRKEFCLLMREHRFLGDILKLVDEINTTDECVDDIYWNNYLYKEETFVLRSKKDGSFAGYIYVESINSHSPEMTMQFDKQKLFEDIDFSLIRDLYNWISKTYLVRAIKVYINSLVERELFEYLGFENVEDEIVIPLPI